MSMRELSSEPEIPPYSGNLPYVIFEFRRLCGGCEKSDMVQEGITDLFISQVRAHSYGTPDCQARFWNGKARPSVSACVAVARDLGYCTMYFCKVKNRFENFM